MDEKLNLREQGLGHTIPLKTAAIEDALDRATIQVGNLHVNCQHLVQFSFQSAAETSECKGHVIGQGLYTL